LFGPQKVNSEWTHNNFNGFWTQKVSSYMAGEKYLCKGQLDRYMKEQDEVFDVLVSSNLELSTLFRLIISCILIDIQLAMIHPHEKEMIVDGDEITIKCTAFNQSVYLEWSGLSNNRKVMVKNISMADGAPKSNI